MPSLVVGHVTLLCNRCVIAVIGRADLSYYKLQCGQDLLSKGAGLS